MSPCVKYLITWLFCMALLPLFAQNTRKNLEDRKKKIQLEIEETEKLISDIRKSKTVSLGQLNMLNRKLEERKKLIQTIQGEISLLNSSIKSNDERIGELQNNLDRLKENYGRIIRQAYMNRRQQSVLLLVLSSKDVHQASQRLQYLKSYNTYLRNQAMMIQGTQTELSDHVSRLKTDLSDKTRLLGSEERENKTLSKEKKEQEIAVSELKKKENKLRKDLIKKQADVKRVNSEIQRIIEREIALERERAKAKATPAKPANPANPKATEPAQPPEMRITPETRAISGRFEANKGRLPWPVEKGVITESFGSHAHPVLKNIVTFNNGIDISTNLSASVKAIFDGEVSGVISIPGANQALILKHGEYLTVYGNLDRVNVQRGDKIKAGQVLGSAAAGDIEGRGEAHLEIWKGKNKLDPADWIAR